jgi:hypothetical protein
MQFQNQKTNERFLFGKTRKLVTNTVAMRDLEDMQQIVDLEIYKGGSIALNILLFEPLKLVGM